MSEAEAPRKALIILHQAHSNPGRVGRWLREAGFQLDIRRPSLGEELPRTLADHAGAVIFGGPMSANDSEDWLRRETDWIATPLAENKPFLGLCLGGQMLAKRLGARVFTYDDRRCEAGYYPIYPTSAGDALCAAPFPRHAYHWHSDGFELPRGAALLARGDGNFPVQAFRYGRNAIALQFHPEVTYQMMCRWSTRGAERLTRPGARPPHEHLQGWYLHDQAVARWLDSFLTQWIGDALPVAELEACAPGSAGGAALTLAAAYPSI